MSEKATEGKKIVPDFDKPLSRDGTHAEKYCSLERIFKTSEAEPFWVADMDLQSPPFLVDALKERLEHPMFGYTAQYSAVFDSIIWWFEKENGVELESDWIRLSPSVVTSLSAAICALSRPEEGVVLLSPVYGPFYSCIENNTRRVVDCNLKVVNGKHRINFPSLEKELSKSETSLLLLCNPHNPGGRSWDWNELERLVQVCTEYDVKIFCDEIHSDIVYPPNEHVSLLKIKGANKISILAHSIGKTFNTSGLKASFAVIPDAGLKERFVETTRRNHSQSVNLLGMLAIETLFSKNGAEYKRELIAYLQKSISLVVEKLQSVDGLNVIEPEATFLLWCDFRRLGSWPYVMERLVNEAGVALSGGTFFGPSGEGWFRINCAHPRSRLLGATERIVQTFSG